MMWLNHHIRDAIQVEQFIKGGTFSISDILLSTPEDFFDPNENKKS